MNIDKKAPRLLGAAFLLQAIARAHLVLMNTMLKAEERFLLKKYGEEYREYMNRTSKWIGIPKSREK